MINSETNLHSTKYTSPLKYFEYLYAGLSVVAVDYKAHRILPYSESISFFNSNNKSNFINDFEINNSGFSSNSQGSSISNIINDQINLKDDEQNHEQECQKVEFSVLWFRSCTVHAYDASVFAANNI